MLLLLFRLTCTLIVLLLFLLELFEAFQIPGLAAQYNLLSLVETVSFESV